VEEKDCVDKKQCQMSKDIATNNNKLVQCQEMLAKIETCVANDTTKYQSSEQVLSELQKKCAVERATQYSIKLKKLVENKVLETGVSPDIHMDALCGCSLLLFAPNSTVPYSCR